MIQHLALGALIVPTLVATPPRFRPRDAVEAAWKRQPMAEKAGLSGEESARALLTISRIGAPGASSLLPPELEKPTEEAWLAKAHAASTPQERVTALFFLGRLRSPRALDALKGLTEADAATWPATLQLSGLVATACLRGGSLTAEVQRFLDALAKAGKEEPVRAQAAWLRLHMAGQAPGGRLPIPATPHATLALMDAWNAAPWESRAALHQVWLKALNLKAPTADSLIAPLTALGLRLPDSGADVPGVTHALLHRLFEGLPKDGHMDPLPWMAELIPPKRGVPTEASATLRFAYAAALSRTGVLPKADLLPWLKDPNPSVRAQILPAIRKSDPGLADTTRDGWLLGSSTLLRAAAMEDLSSPPKDLKGLVAQIHKDDDLDTLQALVGALERWKLPKARAEALLKPFLRHRDWGWRFAAYQALKGLNPKTPWPTAPAPTREEEIQLRFAQNLAREKAPVRVRLVFSGGRKVILRLDPANAPLNVANFIRLARKGAFRGRRVGRVVPNFVLQTGSPFDTMDGGPGYTVRCENSLDWYGPGSIGVALSGKDTGGCQWFITLNATPHLTGRYTRLGEVEDLASSLPVLDAMELGARIEQVQVLR